MSVPDLTLLVYYGEGKEVEVKVPAEFTVDRAKKAILAKVPEFAGAQTSEYLLSIAGAFLTTEFSKLGTLEVVRESDLSQPIKVKLLRRVKIRGGIVSPRPGHIATTWEPATQPKAFAGTPRRHSHSTELSPVTEESFEHEEAQELRIELAHRDKLIAQQKRELDNLASYNAELVRLLEAHSIPVPPAPHTTAPAAAARPPDQASVDKKHTTVPTLTTTAADPPKPTPVDKKKSDEKQKKEKNAEESNREEKEASSEAGGKQRKSGGGGGGSSRAPEEAVSGGPTSPKTKEAKEAAAAGAPTKKKQKSKEKDEKEKEKKEKDKEKETKRKKKFTWKSAGKKQGAAMKDALARGDVDAEEVTEEQARTPQAEAEAQKPEPTVDSSNDDASEVRKRDSGTLQDPGSTPTKAKASAVASQVAAPSPPQSPAATAKSPHSPLIASLASEDSRGNKRNSLSNIWRKGKKDRSDSIGSSPSRERRAESVPSGATSEAMPFPGIRFHQTTSSLEDLVAAAGADDDQQPQPVAGVSADPSDLVAATVGGSAASAIEESSTREGRSGSGGGSGVFGKRNSRGKKAGKDSRGSGSGIRSPKTTESVDNNKIEAPAKEETAVVSDGEKASEGAESAPPAKRERSESANARRGTMAFYDVMRAGAEKMVVAGDLEATSPKNESEDEKKNENGDANENGGVEAEQEKKENAAVPPTENGENTGGAEEVKKVERKLTPEEHAQKIREEFIKTEEKYTQNLDILLTQYMTPLRQAAAATNEEERIIATKEVEKIFSRELSLLQTMHSHLLKELKVSTTSSEFIDAFFSFVPYLKTYTAYVNNFTTSNKALSELIKSNAKLQKFIQDTYERLNAEFVKEAGEEKMSDNQTQVDLRGLLIMPIQRLPRYELLLRDLAKHTTESEDENEKLQKLLKDVQKLNQHINEAKRKDENTNKLVEIQNAIKTKGDKAFTLFDRVGRQFVREGKLETRELHTDPAKKIPGFARGYVFLFDDLLVLTKPEKGGADAPRTYVLVKAYSLSGYTASSHFELASCEVEEKEKERIISLVPIEKEGRVIQLKAHSAPDRQVWLDDVSKHIQHALQRVLGSTPTPPANRKGS